MELKKDPFCFLRECRTTTELFDRLRDCHGYAAPDRISGLWGFVLGYAEAADLDETLRRDMQTFVEQYLGVADDRWETMIENHAKRPCTEVALAYAALDFGRQTMYRNAVACAVPRRSQLTWNRSQKRVCGRNGTPAPERVVIAESHPGTWRLFFLDNDGVRIKEATRTAQDNLQRWAISVLGLEGLQWRAEPAELFNRPPAELRR
ncbi:MAG TPA: hypothetical protein VJ724_11300 [Tahibacter sp.]|nr:hypothetical protein [Tahibacter sp.]